MWRQGPKGKKREASDLRDGYDQQQFFFGKTYKVCNSLVKEGNAFQNSG